MRCDSSLRNCVAANPPNIPDYLQPCKIDLSGFKGGDSGYVDAVSCSGGVCLVSPLSKCVASACSIPCKYDSDCPQSSECRQKRRVSGGYKEAGICYHYKYSRCP